MQPMPEYRTPAARRYATPGSENEEAGAPRSESDCWQSVRRLEEENDQLRQVMNVDYSTGLPIRRVLEDHLRPRIAVPTEEAFAIGVVRLDERFHQRPFESEISGMIAFSVGQRLSQLAPGQVYQSWRTDEFIVLIEDETVMGELEAFGDRIRQVVMAPFPNQGYEIRLGCHVGFARFPDHGTTVADLLGNAGIAMGVVERREGTSSVYRASMGHRRRRVFEIEHALAAEIQRGLSGFSLAFQPIVDRDRVLRGAEALIRWTHREIGPVAPSEFIPVAEQFGQIQILGLWVAYNAATLASQWSEADRKHPIISINVSTVQLRDDDFAERFVNVIESAGGDPTRFRVELTESVIVENPEAARDTFENLRGRGVSLLLDDFGTGFSSFSYLHALPITTIKIAKEFVDTVTGSEQSRAIVRSIVSVAHGIGGTALAEGVETEEQFHVLVEEGCDYFQGYLFGRPQNVARLEELAVLD